jgi:hypothetical protein
VRAHQAKAVGNLRIKTLTFALRFGQLPEIPMKTGPAFFTRCGWEPEQIHSVMHAAAKIKRLPLFLRLIAMISPARFQPNRPWSGVCLMGRRAGKLRVES